MPGATSTDAQRQCRTQRPACGHCNISVAKLIDDGQTSASLWQHARVSDGQHPIWDPLRCTRSAVTSRVAGARSSRRIGASAARVQFCQVKRMIRSIGSKNRDGVFVHESLSVAVCQSLSAAKHVSFGDSSRLTAGATAPAGGLRNMQPGSSSQLRPSGCWLEAGWGPDFGGWRVTAWWPGGASGRDLDDAQSSRSVHSAT